MNTKRCLVGLPPIIQEAYDRGRADFLVGKKCPFSHDKDREARCSWFAGMNFEKGLKRAGVENRMRCSCDGSFSDFFEAGTNSGPELVLVLPARTGFGYRRRRSASFA